MLSLESLPHVAKLALDFPAEAGHLLAETRHVRPDIRNLRPEIRHVAAERSRDHLEVTASLGPVFVDFLAKLVKSPIETDVPLRDEPDLGAKSFRNDVEVPFDFF